MLPFPARVEGGWVEQDWEFFQPPPSPWSPPSSSAHKRSENLKIVRKLSETGLERSSRALDKSGWVKIAFRIQWKASRTPKPPRKIQKLPKTPKIKDFGIFPYRTPDQPPQRPLCYSGPFHGRLLMEGCNSSIESILTYVITQAL